MDVSPERESPRLLTRRRALGVLGGGSAGLLGGVAGLLAGGGSVGGTTTISTVAWRGRPLQTAAVPTDWYERERRAGAVLDDVRSRYADATGVLDVALGTAGEAVAGRPTSSIDVYVDPEVDAPVRVPATVDGVVSRLVEARPPELLAAGPGSVRDVGGGTTLRSRSGATASATCGVTWQDERYLLTCAHLFEGQRGDCADVDGQAVYSASGRRIGRVVRSDRSQDWALVDDSAGGVRFGGSIADVEGEICGRVTAAGLRHLKSEGVEVFKNGQATRERRGPIQAVGVRHGGCDLGSDGYGRRYVDVDVPAIPGDSGGPIYHKFEYNGRRLLAMVGVIAARVDWTRACTADAIHQKHDVEFAPTSPFPF